MKRVAVIGTVGVPAAYGGFETLVENIIGDNCSDGIAYTIFCSSKDCKQRLSTYKGAQLKYVALKANGVQSIPYDIISLVRSLRGYDVVVVLGVSGGIFFPIFKLLSRSKFVVNIDGLEWKRAKWGGLAKLYLRLSERLALMCADTVIADNQAIVDYIGARYSAKTVLIAYGSDHVVRDVTSQRSTEILQSYNISSGEYAMTVCRIEPENNCEMILSAFSKSGVPLLFVGNWNKSAYGMRLKEHYSTFMNITILDAIYDLDILHVLRTNSKYYIHGHSAGGTNPSLVEAMFCGCNVVAFDVAYNRETTEQRALFFRNEEELIELTSGGGHDRDSSQAMSEIANRRYTWATIARQYEALY